MNTNETPTVIRKVTYKGLTVGSTIGTLSSESGALVPAESVEYCEGWAKITGIYRDGRWVKITFVGGGWQGSVNEKYVQKIG